MSKARDYKNFHEGGYYHIYNRGNNRQRIFFDDQDYNNFLKRCALTLNLPASSFGKTKQLSITPLPNDCLDLVCYCLMPTHFHFLLKQNANISPDKFIAKVCNSYVRYVNEKYGRVGGLFQDQFKAKVVDSDSYLQYLSVYIHKNPSNPLEYPHSSLGNYLGAKNEEKSLLCNPAPVLQQFNNDPKQYFDFFLRVKPAKFDEETCAFL